MKRLVSLLCCVFVLAFSGSALLAQPASPPPAAAPANTPSHVAADQAATDAANKTAAAAVVQSAHAAPHAPDFLESLVDEILALFDVRKSGNTWTHYSIAALLLAAAFLLRHLVTRVIFGILKKLAARTTTTLDDKLFPALERPVAVFISVTGIFAALSVLKLSETADAYVGNGATIAYLLVMFWIMLRAFGAVLDHFQEVAVERQMGVAAFMPWIRKTLVSLFVIFGLLIVVQSLGFDVKALLAGLGIGGLAFALAAQDTLANVFGSIVVAVDQPFKIGETVQIGSNLGTVEDIGLRSTKLRRLDKSLVVIPNKTVAGEAILNLARFTGRRSEQVLTLTYDATPEQLDGLVGDLRTLLLAETEIDPTSINVYFRDLNTSSLDIWVVYVSKSPDFAQHMTLRQRLNLTFMRLVQARGLSFAFPTQTMHLGGEVARQLIEPKLPPPPAR